MGEAVKPSQPQGPDEAQQPSDSAAPEQLSLATVNGEAWLDVPDDLYIPPDALEVILEQFEGPLDLLLYLIRKQKLDIATMPVLEITRQYMQYIDAMQQLRLELAGEYLVMAALLTEIKSRILLPVVKLDDDEDIDPRAELIRRLQEYELYKDASEKVDALPRQERDIFNASADKPQDMPVRLSYPEVALDELFDAMRGLLSRASSFTHHEVKREKLSTRAKMSEILASLEPGQFVPFHGLIKLEEGREGVVVSFLAVLSLIKARYIKCVQSQPLGPIQVILHDGDDDQE
ncbi:segregation and condensation protein A [Aliagarivorans marinus]|uniref:segregation and condensation protein A n=1 Tax=Aliagarivorans marinus TaxID=561965 RepID=UPI000412D0C2